MLNKRYSVKIGTCGTCTFFAEMCKSFLKGKQCILHCSIQIKRIS